MKVPPRPQWAVMSVLMLIFPTGGQIQGATWSSLNLTPFADVARWLPDVGVLGHCLPQAGLTAALPRRAGTSFRSDGSLPRR